MSISQLWEATLFDSFEKYGFVFTLYQACLAFGAVVFLCWLIGILLRGIWTAPRPGAMARLGKSLVRWVMCVIAFCVPLSIGGIVLWITL